MKSTIIAVVIAFVFIGGAMYLSRSSSASTSNNEPIKENVTMVSGTQIIDLTAKGGYTPRKSIAKAGIPTILRVNTSGTFDCSSSIRIPSMNISQNLPQSGATEIALGSPVAGVLNGTCGMGMYPFEINFQ